MAHGWDSYFHSLPPLLSESRTLKVSSELEGSLSQPVENILGHHDIANTVVSQGHPTTTPNLSSNPSLNGSDCVYQTYYGTMPWQADIQETDKDVLSRCANGNIPNFAIEELSTSSHLLDMDLQDIKQDCGILTSSFLEDFSDVSTCSDADVNEMRPPCKFMKHNSLMEPNIESQEIETIKQNQPEWSVTSVGSLMSTSTENLCISETPLVLPISSTTATADLPGCVKTIKETQDDISQPCMQNYQVSHTSDNKCIEENEKLEDCQDQQQLNVDLGKDIVQAHDPQMGGHKLLTEDFNKEQQGDNWEVQICDDQKKYRESTVFTQNSLTASGTVEKNSHDNVNEIEMQELTESKLQQNEDACNEQEHPSSSLLSKAGDHLKNDDGEDMQQSTSNSSDLQDKCLAAHSILPASADLVEDGMDDENRGMEENEFEAKSKENTEVGNKWNNVLSSLISGADEGRNVRYGHQEEIESTSESSEAQHRHISDSQPNTSKLKYTSTVDTTCFTESQIDMDDFECCPQGVGSLQFPDNQSLNKPSEETICSGSIDDRDFNSIDSCENDKQRSDNLKSTLITTDSNVEQTHSSQHSLTAVEIACLTSEPPENGCETFQEVDESIEEKPPLDDMMYGEPLSEEDSTSDIVETLKPESNEAARNENEQTNPVQAAQLTCSAKMWKRLQPVVVLKNQELRSVKKTYHCACCQHSTQNVDEIMDHHHSKHSNHEFNFCKICNIYLLNKESAERHLCGVFEVPQLFVGSAVEKKMKCKHMCKDCKLTFTRFSFYVKHMRAHTGKTPYKCKCGKYFAQTCSLRRHMRIPGRCPLQKRNVTPANNGTVAKAKMARSGSPIASLPECYVKLVDVCKTNTCKVCSESFITTDHLGKHKQNVHKIKSCQNVSEGKSVCTVSGITEKHKCPLCPRVFKYSFNMTRHLRDCIRVLTYGRKGKVGNCYRCPLCRATFTHASNRHRHIKNTCLKEYRRKFSKMKTKLNKMDEQKKDVPPVLPTPLENVQHYKCSLCPAVFLYSSGKYRHMKKHELFKNTGKVFKFRHTSFSLLCKKAKLEYEKTQCKDGTLNSKDTSNSLVFTCQFCERGFNTSLLLRKHELNHKGEKPYRCLECGRQYKKCSSLIAHKSVHQRKIQCTVCKKILKNIRELIEHRKTHLKRGMLQCPDCPLKFQYPVYLLRHLPTHARELKAPPKEKKPQAKVHKSVQALEPEGHKLLKCLLCKYTFSDSNALTQHSLSHITGSSQQCPFCKRHFSSQRYLLRHMRTHSGDKPFPCSTCGKQFYSVKYLMIHQEKSHGIKPLVKTDTPPVKVKNLTAGKKFPCQYCSRVFNRKPRLKKHHDGHKTKSLLVCSKCGQHFGTTKLTQHVRQCSGLSSNFSGQHDKTIARKDVKVLLNCPHCPEKFKYRSLLLRHIVKHTGEQPYACMHCGQKYESKSRCLKHEAFCDGVHRDKNSTMKCDVQVSSFKEANQNQQSEGEYKCKFCTKTFTKSRYLRRHILTHTEVKPYRCKACDSCFSRYDHLELHQTHCKGKRQRLEICIPKISIDAVGKGWQKNLVSSDAKEQCFECNICSKSFSTKSNLERHYTMLHNTKNAFICTRCGSGFTLEKSLKRHRLLKCKNTSIKTNRSFEEQFNQQTKKLSKLCAFSDKNRKYICKFCPRSFRTHNHLVVHTRLHTGEKPYGCDGCGERFIRKDYLLRHLSKCAQEKEATVLKHCDRCGGLFFKDKLKNHINSCTAESRKSPPKRPPNTFCCAYCDSHFVIFSELQHHLILAHPEDTLWQSPMSAVPLQQHFSNAVNNKEDPLDDGKVDEKLSSDGMFDNNTDFDKRSRPFKCTLCNKQFLNKSGLQVHARFHGRQTLYACMKCKREFRDRNLQRRHSRKCKGLEDVAKVYPKSIAETPITSEIDLALNDSVILFNNGSQTTGTGVLQANFSCKDESNSEGKHEQSSSKVPKSVHYQCSECDQSFTDGLLLISHLEDHGREEQGIKNNTCTQCGKMCSSKGHLMQHMKSHNANSYSCPDCPETFLTLKELGIHRTYHDPNRPFSCKLCQQKFWTNKSLHNHYSDAHPDDVYACRFCKKKYSVKKSLIRHYRMRHRKCQLNEEVYDNEDADQHKVNTELSGSDNECDSDNVSTDHSDSDAAPYFPCHVCGKTFLTSESLEDHQRCHLGEKPHECAECGKCFFHASQLQHHQRMHKTEFQCQTCGRGFVSLFALRKHKHTHGKSRPYRCSKCHLSFTGPSQLAEHMATHREDNFPCDLCNCTFSCKSSRVEHRKSHSESSDNVSAVNSQDDTALTTKNLTFSCGVCKEHFDHPEDLSLHGCRLHTERQYSCPKCDKHFIYASHLIKHVVTHQPSGPYVYKCYQCNITVSSYQYFLSHLRRHVDSDSTVKFKGNAVNDGRLPEVFLCPVCYEHYANAIEFLHHVSAHSDIAYQCKNCNMAFPTKRKLEEHERCHLTAATQFECTVCAQSFLGSDAFRQHNCSHREQAPTQSKYSDQSINKSSVTPDKHMGGEEEDVDVTGEDSYNCPFCSKRFSSKSSLLEHQNKQHQPGNSLRCDICGKTFSHRGNLNKHKKRHLMKMEKHESSDVKRFKCLQCSTAFETMDRLSLHMKMNHKNVGQHRCDMCYRSFSQLSHLRQHQETHVGQVVYECTECDKAFAFPHLLEKHQQSHAGPSPRCC